MKPEDFFNYNPENGEWRNKASGYRFVLLGEPFYINMILNLTKQFGSAAGVFIYQSGLGIGAEMGKLIINAPNLLMGIQTIFKNTYSAGWGKMTLEDLSLDTLISDKPVAIIEENGFFAELSQREGADNLTPFIKGVFTGVFDTLRGTEHTCEMMIIEKDPIKCRYVVTPLN